eukprot:15437463-Alexandrium_andersonii.AAC.1
MQHNMRENDPDIAEQFLKGDVGFDDHAELPSGLVEYIEAEKGADASQAQNQENPDPAPSNPTLSVLSGLPVVARPGAGAAGVVGSSAGSAASWASPTAAGQTPTTAGAAAPAVSAADTASVAGSELPE